MQHRLPEALTSHLTTTWSNSAALLLTVKSNGIRHYGEFKHGSKERSLVTEMCALTATADSADRVKALPSHGNAKISSQASSWAGVMHGHVSNATSVNRKRSFFRACSSPAVRSLLHNLPPARASRHVKSAPDRFWWRRAGRGLTWPCPSPLPHVTPHAHDRSRDFLPTSIKLHARGSNHALPPLPPDPSAGRDRHVGLFLGHLQLVQGQAAHWRTGGCPLGQRPAIGVRLDKDRQLVRVRCEEWS